jgi:hypothetical protein
VTFDHQQKSERFRESTIGNQKGKNMKKYVLLVAAVTLLGAVSAFAQPVSDSINVTATNNGIFQFAIAQASFDFGSVDANATGGVSSTGVPGARNGAPGTGAVYTAVGAANWTAASAPTRTVHIFNASVVGSSTINWGAADRLEVRVPAAGGGTSCAFKTYSTVGNGGTGDCDSGNLVHGMSVGNGANDVDGTIDFRLTVLDTDTAGSTNTWVVTLTATNV